MASARPAPRAVTAPSRRGRRATWTVFWVLSGLALGAGVAGVLASGNRSSLGPFLIIGLCLVGVAAAVVAADGPPPVSGARRLGSLDGGHGGDAGGFGDCGGGGGDGGCG